MKNFTIKDFNNKYPNDDTCLKAIFEARYGGKTCPNCTRLVKFYKLKDRKCYLCNNCKVHIYPLADTIFHKSETSLKDWFYAIYLFSTSKNGVSALELQRQLGGSYKRSWRMAKQIRTLMSQHNHKTTGTYEADETFYGGKDNKRGRGDKTPIFGLVRRKSKSNQSKIIGKVVKNTTASNLMPIIRSNVAIGSDLMTDEAPIYNKAKKYGYYHGVVKHKEKEYARGFTHTNTIEGFWSQLKRSIDGTYHAVSRKYLQAYLDEFVYRYNHRTSSVFLFDLLLGRVVQKVG